MMKKKTAKLAALSVCAALSVAMLCGCGKKDDDKTAETTPVASNGDAQSGATADIKAMKMPEIDASAVKNLGDYKNFTYDKFVAEIDIEQARDYYNEMIDGYVAEGIEVNLKNEERQGTAVESGDSLNIDFTGYMDGEAFDKGSATGQELTIGSGKFMPGFEDALIGKKVGDTVMIDVTFPDEYPNDPTKAGKPAQFQVVINYVYKTETISRENGFVYFKFDSLDDCLKDIQNYMQSNNTEESYRLNCLQEYINYVAENSEFEDISAKAQDYANGMFSIYEQVAALNGVDISTMIMYYGFSDVDSFKQELARSGEMQLKNEALLLKIAEAENVTVSDEDANKMAETLAAEQEYESADEFKKNYEDRFGEGSFRRMCVTEVLNEKFFDEFAKEK